tara:strand:- start:4542 stop:4643 length:102 start_codon:yes stop_codon:yes gene_type:complete
MSSKFGAIVNFIPLKGKRLIKYYQPQEFEKDKE